MNVVMSNVKFGECFILEEGCNSLIVDCGSKNAHNGLNTKNFPFTKIEPYINQRNLKLDLLITHFDYDHYSGILFMDNKHVSQNCKKRFENIYLPYFIWLDKKASLKRTGLIRAMAYLTILSDYNISKNLVLLFNILPKIVKSNSKIRYLKKDDTFNLGNNKLEVLWPSVFHCTSITKDIKNNFEEINQKLKDILEDNYQSTQSLKIEETVVKFENHLTNVYSFFLRNSSEASHVNELMDKNEVVKYDEEKEKEFNEKLEKELSELNKTMDKFKKIRNNLIIKSLEDNTVLNTLGIKAKKNIIDEMNACSIVFHEVDSKIPKVLFLGDATENVVDKIFTCSSCFNVKSYYEVIKVQHHGTKKYYHAKIPIAKYYLISNNGYKKWPISEKHLNLYKKNGGFILCTNSIGDNCEYFKANKRCCNDMVHRYTKINLCKKTNGYKITI